MSGALPAELDPLFAAGLVAASFFTSALTAGFGIGGGVALLAVMAYGMPPVSLIPVHGLVQMTSNLGRAAVQRAHIAWGPFGWFALGAVGGAVLGGRFVVALPEAWLGVGLGAFVLLVTWIKPPALLAASRAAYLAGGAGATFLTMFFGATGPFVMAVFTHGFPDRMTLVATHAATMVAQHGLKAVVFGFLGFSFTDYLPLIVAMTATGFAGTLFGTAVLKRLPETRFRAVLKAVLTLLALDLIRHGLGL